MEFAVEYNSALSLFDGLYYPVFGVITSIIFWKMSGFLNGKGLLHILSVCLKWIAYFVILLTLLLGIGFIMTNAKPALASMKNTCTIIEGKVESFGTSPDGMTEIFTIQNRPFKYSKYNITGGLNRSSVRGGPIYEGMHARICYIKTKKQRSPIIVRVEVPENSGNSLAKPKTNSTHLSKEQKNWTITPIIDHSLTNNRLIKVPPFVQAVAYANAVARVCELDVTAKVTMDQITGMNSYLYKRHRAEGRKHDEPILGGPVSYLTALRATNLINRDGSAVKTDAETLCTQKVKTDLLGDLETIGTGELEKVDFVAAYLNE